MDPKLKLKPIELLDIGIDKHTKIPVPILNDNVVSTFNMENGAPSDSFTFSFDSHYSGQVFSATIISDWDTNLVGEVGTSINSNLTFCKNINATLPLEGLFKLFQIFRSHGLVAQVANWAQVLQRSFSAFAFRNVVPALKTKRIYFLALAAVAIRFLNADIFLPYGHAQRF